METQLSSGFLALFPGQGAQHVGMGKDLFANFEVARAVFEEASEAIKFDLKKLCFDGPDSDLTLTMNTQPALLVTSVAAFRVAEKELGFKPVAVAGHSLGEYSALVCARALPLASAARWVRERGRSMQEAVPAGQGTMAAILSAEDEAVEKLCRDATEAAKAKRGSPETSHLTVDAVVEPANYNAPGQLVIAGSVDAVAEAVELAKSGAYGKAKAMPLNVSAPFHCSLMRKSRDRMAELFVAATAAEKPQTLLCPYFPNRTARLSREPGVIFELLVEQVDHPVLWKQSVLSMLAHGASRSVEFGPGKVLQGLAKRIPSAEGKNLAVTTLGDPTALLNFEKEYRG